LATGEGAQTGGRYYGRELYQQDYPREGRTSGYLRSIDELHWYLDDSKSGKIEWEESEVVLPDVQLDDYGRVPPEIFFEMMVLIVRDIEKTKASPQTWLEDLLRSCSSFWRETIVFFEGEDGSSPLSYKYEEYLRALIDNHDG
jgi:hypothetical protein